MSITKVLAENAVCFGYHDVIKSLKVRSSRAVNQPALIGSDYGRLLPRGEVEALLFEGFGLCG
jgi:hypothetical protein